MKLVIITYGHQRVKITLHVKIGEVLNIIQQYNFFNSTNVNTKNLYINERELNLQYNCQGNISYL